MKTRKPKAKRKETEATLADQAAAICLQFHMADISDEERQQIHDQLLLYPKRVDALIKTLMVMSFFEFRAAAHANPLGIFSALNKTDAWRDVCLSIACHHVAHKEQWKEERK